MGCCINNLFDGIDELLAVQGLRCVAIVNMNCYGMSCTNNLCVCVCVEILVGKIQSIKICYYTKLIIM